jgi:hypothetical protein
MEPVMDLGPRHESKILVGKISFCFMSFSDEDEEAHTSENAGKLEKY